MTWEDVLKVRRRPKKKLPPSNPFAGESKRHEETEAGKLETKEAEEAVRQAKLDEERKLVRRGKRIRPQEAKKLSRGKDDPNSKLGYCERCAGLLAGTLNAKDFKGIDIAAFKSNRGKGQSSRKHWQQGSIFHNKP